ncbi:hypothetical protein LSAT2_031032 [Lamellibrachia satsuma]|nr:hypothetical protein LSAT2_031032 [Lamellibrachia satsuma]
MFDMAYSGSWLPFGVPQPSSCACRSIAEQTAILDRRLQSARGEKNDKIQRLTEEKDELQKEVKLLEKQIRETCGMQRVACEAQPVTCLGRILGQIKTEKGVPFTELGASQAVPFVLRHLLCSCAWR